MKIIFVILTTMFLSQGVWAKPLPDYQPLLAQTKSKIWAIDPKVDYTVQEVGKGTYVISDGIWQSAFVVTKDGVIVLDAPETYAAKLPLEISKHTSKPIKYLVYSHAHKDHIGGSAVFKDIKDLKIVALESTHHFLLEKQDPNRLIPNMVFSGKKTIELGGVEVQLTNHRNYHSDEGDLLIYVPHSKFLLAVDTITPDYVPFMGFDLSSNFHEYMRMFDDILSYDFKIFSGGHLSHMGTRKDVELAKEFTLDVYETTKRVHANTNMYEIMGETAKIVGWDNKFALFDVFLNKVMDDATSELTAKWGDRLSNADIWMRSHVRTALIYIRWDD